MCSARPKNMVDEAICSVGAWSAFFFFLVGRFAPGRGVIVSSDIFPNDQVGLSGVIGVLRDA